MMVKNDKFTNNGIKPVKDDPFAELFADCQTPDEILQLQREIDEMEKSEARKDK